MVMDYIGVILLGCFVAFVILGPLSCLIYARRREHQKYHPGPKAFQKARRKLSSVTECRAQGEKCSKDNEAWGGDCPICIGPLCPIMTPDNLVEKEISISGNGSGVPSTSVNPGTIGDDRSQADGQRAVEPAPEDDAFAGPAPHQLLSAPHPSTSKETSEIAEGRRPEDGQDRTAAEPVQKAVVAANPIPTNRDMEVLKLKACGHAFHSLCLLTWFLTERYDCPVCRTRYWMGAPSRIWFTSGQVNYTMTSARMTMGAVV